MRGLFITFEGGEGAGKTTQIERLRRKLEKRGTAVTVTREPGGTPKAEAIRDCLLKGVFKPYGALAEAVMFNAARIDHLDQVIRPALRRGETVLCDRFADSTRAYQGAAGLVDADLILKLEQVSIGSSKPNLTFVLDLPPEIGASRARVRALAKGESTDRFESEPSDFHRKLRRAFLAIAEAEPERCVIVNARQSEADVEAAIWGALIARDLAPAARGFLG